MTEDPGIAIARVDGLLLDLLMAVMNSLDVWIAAAGDRRRGLEWRDAVTAKMLADTSYVPYEDLVAATARELAFGHDAPGALLDRWGAMEPWPDAPAIAGVRVPYAFVTNCSTLLAEPAARRSGLKPRFVLTAEEAGCYKPDARIYHEARRRLGTRAERTLFVAGAPYDADGAAAAGLRAAFVARRPDGRHPSAAVSVVRSLVDIAVTLDAAADA